MCGKKLIKLKQNKNMNKIILSVIVSLVIGGGVGYMIGQGGSDVGMNTKDAQASIAMMKDQTVTIQKMSAMMKDAGVSLEGWSTQYKDNDMMMKAKDMQTVAEKYMKTTNTTTGTGMNKMMGN